MAISAANSVASGRRSVALGLEGRDRLCGFCCEVVAAGLDRGNGPRFEVVDPGAGRVQPLALLALLCDGDRHRFLGSVERTGRVAHLLIEDQQRVLIGDLLGDRDGASAHERDQGLEHPCLRL